MIGESVVDHDVDLNGSLKLKIKYGPSLLTLQSLSSI